MLSFEMRRIAEMEIVIDELLDMVLSNQIFAKYKEVLLEDFRQSNYAKLSNDIFAIQFKEMRGLE